MAQASFDLRDWLSKVDLNGADESLDEQAARLFGLNDALLNPSVGPTLAELIVAAGAGRGLDFLVELADCSEPRLAMMAIVNILNVIQSNVQPEQEDSSSDSSTMSQSSSDMSLSTPNARSTDCTRSRIVTATADMAHLFLKRVSSGDFCPDFLTFLLTALMGLAAEDQKSVRDVAVLNSVATDRFLKTVMRAWKTDDLHQHQSGSETEDSFSLGFLVTCYVSSLRRLQAEVDGATTSLLPEGSRVQPKGLSAIMHLGDWAIKFFLMRIYQSTSTSAERAKLLLVLVECGNRDGAFTKKMLREGVLTAIAFISRESANMEHSHGADTEHSPTVESSSEIEIETVTSSLLLLVHLSNDLLGEVVVPGAGIWFDNKQSQITIALSRAMMAMLKRGWRSSFLLPSDQGNSFNISPSAMCLMSKLFSEVWKAGVRVLFRVYSAALSPLRSAMLTVFDVLIDTVEEFCRVRDVKWEEISCLESMAPLRIGVDACKALKQNAEIWDARRRDGSSDFAGWRDRGGRVCEWCLSCNRSCRFSCGQCRKVWYCAAEHQEAHWKEGHKVECRFFRSCLEGSSFRIKRQGRLRGLIYESDNNDPIDDRTPFCKLVTGQREELLVLGFRMPGGIVERDRLGSAVPDIQYLRKSSFLYDAIQDDEDADVVRVNWSIVKSLVCTSSGSSTMLYLRRRLEDGGESRTLVMHFTAGGDPQALSARLV